MTEHTDPVEPRPPEHLLPVDADPVPAAAAAGPAPRGPRALGRRVVRLLNHVPHPPWTSRRGLLLLFFLVAGFGSLLTAGGLVTAHYTETSSFCGRCHTMGPELKAYSLSPHREVACAECHVEPGAKGFVKAKVNGTKQLVQVLTGTFPRPIPPPDHAALPSVGQTCLRCHSLDTITRNGGPIQLVLRPSYLADEKNTRELVAVVLRPKGLEGGEDDVGVHWHVQQKVTYSTDRPEGAQQIDLVEVTRPDGSTEQYVSSARVAGSVDVAQDVAQIRATQTTRRMDCLDCHNRAGHALPSISQALDESLAAGRLAADLPFVKRESAALLGRSYASTAQADAAIGQLRETYRQKYPLVFGRDLEKVEGAVSEVQRIYRELATPDMKVQAETYPDNLGHQSSPGCFRCHDGTHVQVVDGRLTGKTIPSGCSTCHTFPQVGGQVTGILVGGAPKSHEDRLYVFSHKDIAKGPDPKGQSCGQCHQRSYCENCHSSGAAKVTHDDMLYNHAGAVRLSGGTACAYCHQQTYCGTCHGKRPVLDAPAAAAEPARAVLPDGSARAAPSG